jgi:hypothetical protein
MTYAHGDNSSSKIQAISRNHERGKTPTAYLLATIAALRKLHRLLAQQHAQLRGNLRVGYLPARASIR